MRILRHWFIEGIERGGFGVLMQATFLALAARILGFSAVGVFPAEAVSREGVAVVADTLRQDLTGALAEFVEKREGRSGVAVDIDASGSRVTVNVGLAFTPRDPAFDTEVRSFVLTYIREEIFATVEARPTLRVSVSINDRRYNLFDEFRRDLLLLTAAWFCLLIAFIIRLSPAAPSAGESAVVFDRGHEPLVYEPGTRTPLEARVRLLPTVAFERFQQDVMALPVDPGQGSWYLDALPYVPNERLQNAFQTMPFDQAVVMLKTFRKTHRDNVARRLDLLPAVKSRLE